MFMLYSISYSLKQSDFVNYRARQLALDDLC